jgi:hypothetical protein
MTDFTPLSIHKGHGVVHVNRFRISMRSTMNAQQVRSIGTALMSNMPRYMDGNTAAAYASNKNWNGFNTLKFRGVTRLRPFSVSVFLLKAGGINFTIPDYIRDWAIPDIHTDSVGAAAKNGTGFTAQTLKREFEDADDKLIRAEIKKILSAPNILSKIPFPTPIGKASDLLIEAQAKVLGDFAVHYNQHHFLAGRRGFRFDQGSVFGYNDGRLVFETSAIERFSNIMFEGSQLAMGSIPDMVREVWGQMLSRFCGVHGLRPIMGEPPPRGWHSWGGTVHYWRSETKFDVGLLYGHPQFKSINDLHQNIF